MLTSLRIRSAMLSSAAMASPRCWLLVMARATLRVARASDQVSPAARAVCMARSAASQAMSWDSNLSSIEEARR